MLPSYGDKTTGPTLTEYIREYHGIPQQAAEGILARHSEEVFDGKRCGDLVGWVAYKILIDEGHRCTEKCTEPVEH